MLISESIYTLYVAFMAILLALIAQLHRSLAGSLKWLRFAVTLFVINFGTVWWILLQTSTHHQHRRLIHSDSVPLHVTFYATMILSPLFLLHVLLLEPLVDVRNTLMRVYNRLFGSRDQTIIVHNLPSHDQLEAKSFQNPNNNILSTLSSIETHESDHETESGRVTPSVPRSGSTSSISSNVEAEIQVICT